VFLFQVPIPRVAIPPSVYERRIKPKERSSYSVVSDWTTSEQTVHYEYDMKFQAENPSVPQTELKFSAVLENLLAVFEDRKRETAKFGVVPFILGKNGPPQGMSGGSTTNPFVVPLLAFSLPPAIDGDSGQFSMKPFRVEHFGSLAVTGKVESLSRNEYALSMSFRAEGDALTTVSCKSRFRPWTGQLVGAEGMYTGPDGTLKFKIIRR